MMEYEGFLREEKALLIAPAGHGKTYSLAEAIHYSDGNNLILTHTHAGVSSITNKLRDLGVDPSRYSVETISSFAQRYVTSFYPDDDIPPQEESKLYHPFIIQKAESIFSKPIVRRIVNSTYSGIFVDEYQDCSKTQHRVLMTLSEGMPIRGLGDPLQGIFDFNDELVDFGSELADFTLFPPLDTPYRWNNSGRLDLGNSLLSIRRLLESEKDIDLTQFADEIEVLIAGERDKYDPRSAYFQKLNSLQDEGSLLFIHPDSINKASRLNLAKRFKRMTAIESIDDVDFHVFIFGHFGLYKFDVKFFHEVINLLNLILVTIPFWG